jgi:membrane-associated phospholipid phosphatase
VPKTTVKPAIGASKPIKPLTIATQSILRNPRLRRVLLRDGLAVVLFLGLAATAFHRIGTTPLDRVLLSGYVPAKHSFTFRVASLVTLLGSPGVVVVLGFSVALVAWFRRGSRTWSLACIAAPGIAGVGETTLKLLIARPRPLTAALSGEDGNGFPSGHAAGFCAFACIVAFALLTRSPDDALQPPSRRTLWIILAFTATAIMALTRVLVGAHYPIDVLAGVLVGFVSADVVALVASSLDSIRVLVAADKG